MNLRHLSRPYRAPIGLLGPPGLRILRNQLWRTAMPHPSWTPPLRRRGGAGGPSLAPVVRAHGGRSGDGVGSGCGEPPQFSTAPSRATSSRLLLEAATMRADQIEHPMRGAEGTDRLRRRGWRCIGRRPASGVAWGGATNPATALSREGMASAGYESPPTRSGWSFVTCPAHGANRGRQVKRQGGGQYSMDGAADPSAEIELAVSVRPMPSLGIPWAG